MHAAKNETENKAVEASRELDMLVDKHVMGSDHDPHSCPWCLRDLAGEGYPRTNPHFDHYSRDLKAAWRVVEAIRDKLGDVRVTTCMGGMSHICEIWDLNRGNITAANEEAETVPLVICLAALKAVGAPEVGQECT